MKYYHIHFDQSTYCGIYDDVYIEAVDEHEAERFAKNNAYDILCDYFDENDEDAQDWDEGIYWEIEEITKEEYEENK
jgi:hypothetical protein